MEKKTTREAAGKWPTEYHHGESSGNNHHIVKTSKTFSNSEKPVPVCHAAKGCLAAVLVVLMGIDCVHVWSYDNMAFVRKL